MEISLRKYSKQIGIFITLILLGMLAYFFSDIFTWITLAWVVSLLGSPIMQFLGKFEVKKKRLPASLRAMLVLSLFFLIFSSFIALFVPVIIQQARNFGKVDYQSLMTSLEEPITHANDWLVERGLSNIHLAHITTDSTAADSSVEETGDYPLKRITIDSLITVGEDSAKSAQININLQLQLPEDKSLVANLEEEEEVTIAQLKNKLFQYVSPAKLMTNTVFYTVNLFGNFIVLLTSVSFFAFFFLKDEELFGNSIKGAIPNKYLGQIDTALHQIKQLLTRYFVGIFMQVSLITLYVWLLLSFFGIPNAFLIAFFAAVINVIPYLGPFIGALFAMLVTISANLDMNFYTETLPLIYRVIGVFATMQVLDGFVLQPVIFSNSVLAHPLEIFIVVILGAKFGGITGMIIAIPIYTIIRVIASVFFKEFKLVQMLTEGMGVEVEKDK